MLFENSPIFITVPVNRFFQFSKEAMANLRTDRQKTLRPGIAQKKNKSKKTKKAVPVAAAVRKSTSGTRAVDGTRRSKRARIASRDED